MFQKTETAKLKNCKTSWKLKLGSRLLNICEYTGWVILKNVYHGDLGY